MLPCAHFISAMETFSLQLQDKILVWRPGYLGGAPLLRNFILAIVPKVVF